MRQEGGLGRLRGTAVKEMAIRKKLMRGRDEGEHQVSQALGPDAVGDPTLSPRRVAHLPSHPNPHCSQNFLQPLNKSPCT
jgi:hypothetical protein